MDEPLAEIAPLAAELAPQHCRQHSHSGQSCAWYHGTLGYLRLLGVMSSPAEDRDFLEWVGMLLGTLRMELGQPPDRALLQAPTRTCDTEAQSSFLQFRSCVAIAWLQVRDGDCGGVFEATPPSPIPAPDRLWWAAHQRLAAHCLPDPEGRRTASASALLDGLQAPPAWLTQPWH